MVASRRMFTHELSRRLAQGADSQRAFLTSNSDLVTPPPLVSPETEQIGKLAGILIAVILFGWSVLRFILRPLWDETVFHAWLRKSPDVERHLRDTMFRKDIEERVELNRKLAEGITISTANAGAISAHTTEISRLTSEQRATNTLLQSLPHMSGIMEGMSDSIDRLGMQIDAALSVAKKNGETIAAHSVILMLDHDRRHEARRSTDSLPGEAL